MDNLTHALFGVAVAALRRPRKKGPAQAPGEKDWTGRAVLLACVLAAELPDLDSLWPADDAVLGTLRAHRGPTHALLFSPLVALAAAGLSHLLFRKSRFLPVYGYALASVLFAHLLADVWTGWGTRLLLPFSEQRLQLDWTMVVDPFVTLPLAIAAVWGALRPARWRPLVLGGALVAATYLTTRVGLQQWLTRSVQSAYPNAERISVFPAWLSLFEWRYVAVLPEEYRAGVVRLGGAEATEEQGRASRARADALPEKVRQVPTVREALAWARFPLVEHLNAADGHHTVRVSDLRYHLRGAPTLAFRVELDPELNVTSGALERGGSAKELLERWRGAAPRPP